MNDLRSEIRDAFQKEQAQNPPAANLRQTVTQAVAAQPQPKPNLQWVAVAAAILLAALVVAGLMSTRLANRSNVPAHPKAVVSPSPAGDYGPPPAGVPLFYLQDPNHKDWYVGFDWNGAPRGTIKPHVIDSRLSQAPDGSGFAYAANGKPGYDEFLDRLGQPIGGSPPHTYQDQMWSDDSAHLCTLDYTSQQWHIGLRAPGAAIASVHPVAIPDSVVKSGIIAIGFRSCSPRNDRAVLAYSFSGGGTYLWVVRISDGAILMQESRAANVLADVVASPDGSLFADDSNRSTGYLLGGTAPNTTIRRSADGSVVMNLDPTYGVVAFSSDNSLVLVTTTPWASGVYTHLAAIELATGKVAWRYDGEEELAGFFIEPTGAAFAVMLQDPRDQSLHPSVHITMVYVDGIVQGPAGRFVRP